MSILVSVIKFKGDTEFHFSMDSASDDRKML